MKFSLLDTKVDYFSGVTWVEPKTYDVIRMFDKDRVLVQINSTAADKRLLTVLKIADGVLVNEKEIHD